jgi:Rad3-related DNA helicase
MDKNTDNGADFEWWEDFFETQVEVEADAEELRAIRESIGTLVRNKKQENEEKNEIINKRGRLNEKMTEISQALKDSRGYEEVQIKFPDVLEATEQSMMQVRQDSEKNSLLVEQLTKEIEKCDGEIKKIDTELATMQEDGEKLKDRAEAIEKKQKGQARGLISSCIDYLRKIVGKNFLLELFRGKLKPDDQKVKEMKKSSNTYRVTRALIVGLLVVAGVTVINPNMLELARHFDINVADLVPNFLQRGKSTSGGVTCRKCGGKKSH